MSEFKITKASQIKQAVKRGLYHVDSTGLYYRVNTAGKPGTWVQRLHVDGGRRQVKLGRYPAISYVEARTMAVENYRRAQLGQGVVSMTRARQAEVVRAVKGAPTFAAINDEVYRRKLENDWKPGTPSARNWKNAISYALPVIGNRPIDEIGREDVLTILLPLATERPSVHSKLKRDMSAVFAHAIAAGYTDTNPVAMVAGALPKMKSSQSHHAAMPWKDVPAAMKAIESSGLCEIETRAFRFMVLNANRPKEAREARWEEMDMEARMWRIPAGRMKTGVEHRVPLSDAAMAILGAMGPKESGPVFPQKSGKAIAESAFRRVRAKTGIKETSHGFRSSFRDWCADTGKPRELAEAAIAHIVGGVEGSYFRSDIIELRRPLMEAWAAHCAGRGEEKVIPIRAAG